MPPHAQHLLQHVVPKRVAEINKAQDHLLEGHRSQGTLMPDTVKKIGQYTIAIGEGKPKQGEKNALSPIYRFATPLGRHRERLVQMPRHA